MKKILRKIWFQPYTPIIVIVLILLGLYHFGLPFLSKKVDEGIVIRLGGKASTGDEIEDKSASAAARLIVAKIGELIDLPSDEEPQVVTITDIEKFKDQPFFKKATTGNKLLIYPNAKKAILYDEKSNKILDVGPIIDATESAKQLQEYCVAWATQSAQFSSGQPQPSPVLGDQTIATNSATSTPTPTSTEQPTSTPSP